MSAQTAAKGLWPHEIPDADPAVVATARALIDHNNGCGIDDGLMCQDCKELAKVAVAAQRRESLDLLSLVYVLVQSQPSFSGHKRGCGINFDPEFGICSCGYELHKNVIVPLSRAFAKDGDLAWVAELVEARS